jgi:hypothetical protein
MKTTLALVLALALGSAYAAEENKTEAAKKSSKPKPAAKAAEKSDKNSFQKAESSIGQWAHENKVWVRGSAKK